MKALPSDGSAPWMKMKTADFLPCLDKYGQFRWRDWPGKTKEDADLTRAAVKEFDPQILYLGCRFSGSRRKTREACARHADVVSQNAYRVTPLTLEKDYAGIDRPLLIPEFHFGANDRGSFGTGVRQAANVAEKAEMMKRYVRDALAMPQIVGVHWHQFSDEATSGRFDGEYLTVGLTDICDTPYPEMVKALRESGGRMYETRSANDGR